MIETGPDFGLDLTVVTLAVLVLGMLLEMVRPARDSDALVSRWINNGSLALLTYLSNHLFVTLLSVSLLVRLPALEYAAFAMPMWVEVVVVFLVIEFTRYAVHVLMHKVPLLWRLHAVHHSDSAVDISTSFRHHPLEPAFTSLPLTAVIYVLSARPEVLIIYRAVDLVMTVLTHSNVELPERLERSLRRVLVTPAFHRTHHMADQRFTDSNYGASLPWFDYLFGTYAATSAEQQRSEALGLENHTPHEQRLDGMLYAPFVQRRPDA